MVHLFSLPSAPEEIAVLYLFGDNKCSDYARGKSEWYVKMLPDEEMLKDAKIRVNKAYKKGWIKNLTFVELCARIKEQEQLLGL